MGKKRKVPKRPPIQPLGSIYGHSGIPGPDWHRRYEEETQRINARLGIVWTIAAMLLGFIWGAVVEHDWPHILAWMY